MISEFGFHGRKSCSKSKKKIIVVVLCYLFLYLYILLLSFDVIKIVNRNFCVEKNVVEIFTASIKLEYCCCNYVQYVNINYCIHLHEKNVHFPLGHFF